MKAFWLTIMTEAFLLLGSNGILAQETVAASGGSATGDGGIVSFTVGQAAYTANTSASGTITQGVQQPYEIFVIIETDEAKGISLECSVYPNPASDFLKLRIENYGLTSLTYRLFNGNGILIRNGEIISQETIIETGGLSPGAYYLRITDKNKEVITFKIVKN